jgi:hypothetical protein
MTEVKSLYIYIYTFIDFFTDGYVYAIELRKIGCLFSFRYVSTAIVYSLLKTNFATNENGIHISPKIIYIYKDYRLNPAK